MQNESVFHPGITQCANVTYLTIVRNPFHRILSHMSHWNVTVQRLIHTLTGNFTPATTKVWQRQVRGCTQDRPADAASERRFFLRRPFAAPLIRTLWVGRSLALSAMCTHDTI